MLHKSVSFFALATASCLSCAAQAEDVSASNAYNGDAGEIVVIGSGQTRSVSTLLPSNLDVLPAGASAQKALNFLPGVSAQSIDALGVNEKSLSLQVRGFNTTHLGYTLDGVPLGDGAYNNYNGLSISRALISENLGRAELATGIAGLSIPSTSNLGGAVTYFSSDPRKNMGISVNATAGSEDARRIFMRFDTGDLGGFSAYLSGQYHKYDLFVNQPAYNESTGKQFNGKLVYEFSDGKITAFADISRTNQASNAYISKDMLNRLGWDQGGYAPNWQAYLDRAYCAVTGPTAPTQCVDSVAPEKRSDVTFTNGQILRDDNLYYLTGEFNPAPSLAIRVQGYHHKNKGAGNNWIMGWSKQDTVDTSDDIPVRIRDTRYTIDRSGIMASLSWQAGFNHLQAGLWYEDNTSSAARYIWTNVKGPFSLAQYLKGQPDLAQWVQETHWKTWQFYVQNTAKLLDDALTIDFGFKSTYSKSDARAIDGIAKAAPPASSQFASGTLVAKDNFLPEIGVHWNIAPGHELFASYAENMAMFQGGFKLGPQSVSQAVWDLQGHHLKPETSKSVEAGYRYVSGPLQISLAAYNTHFNERLLQYNPCPTNQQQNPGCGNSFHNAGGITSRGVEIGILWKPAPWLSWYNSASYNKSTYDENLDWCTGATCVVKQTKGKQQVDTPKEMLSSVLTLTEGAFSASLMGKYTGRRYYTYTNDQSFKGYATFDLGLGYRFGDFGPLKGAKLGLNITNLTNKRYAANFDNSVFAPDDAAGTISVFHASAPRQIFGSLSFGF